MRSEIKFDNEDQQLGARAGSALTLLRALASANQSPEQFEKACLAWSAYSEEATSLPEFETIIRFLSPGPHHLEAAEKSMSKASTSELSRINISDYFFLDQFGAVSDISLELSTLLQIRLGDKLSVISGKKLQTKDIHKPQLFQLNDLFGLARRVLIHQQQDSSGKRTYAARLIRVSLSANLRCNLATLYGLTDSEQDILELSFRRYKPERIAKLRSNSVLTIRTHINTILHKTQCNSLTEVLALVSEHAIACALEEHTVSSVIANPVETARKISLPLRPELVEYSRYGRPDGYPCVILHSTEYGFIPNVDFIKSAEERGYCLYFLRRPGYGETSTVHSLVDAGQLIADFISTLKLKNVTVVGVSTAAPVALSVPNGAQVIEKTILINYGLNAGSKLSSISPAWVRGLIKVAVENPAGFSIVWEATKTVFRTFGVSRLYNLLYAKLPSDMSFYEKQKDVFEQSGRYILGANGATVRQDLITAFMHFHDLDNLMRKQKECIVANGAEQHKVSPNDAREEAKRLGIAFKAIPQGGRNWMFDRPDEFFDLL